jgi:formate C-acetyltransferase
MDWQYGGTKYSHILQVAGVGIATLADSLAVIKKLVFEEKAMSLSSLVDILTSDFEGKDLLRQKLINRYPKFGNDDDYVDSLAAKTTEVFCQEVIKQNSDDYLITFVPKIYSHLFHLSLGKIAGATANGRKKGEPLLVSRVLEVLKNLGVKRITVHTKFVPAARRVYEKVGFKIKSQKDEDYYYEMWG